ncbi:MAG: hypothetical protein MI799_17935, partial [Desulfobacterales bacterium]|nr:hypothetical protein [Desulfobacterales bacterium]
SAFSNALLKLEIDAVYDYFDLLSLLSAVIFAEMKDKKISSMPPDISKIQDTFLELLPETAKYQN